MLLLCLLAFGLVMAEAAVRRRGSMAMEPTEPHPPETPQDPPAVQDAVWRVRAADAAMRWIPPPPSTVAPRPEREVLSLTPICPCRASGVSASPSGR